MQHRCIAADLRNAYSGQSTGPLEIDRPWDSFTDDYIGLMDYLGIDKFMVMGFASEVRSFGTSSSAHPSCRPGRPRTAERLAPGGARLLLRNEHEGLGTEPVKRRPEITMDDVEKFLTKMYRTNADFVFTVTRDFVRNCWTRC